MKIEKISSKMQPPRLAVEAGHQDWSAVEARFGVVFPSDYKEFLTLYGTGSIGGFLWVLNPFSSNQSLNLDSAEYLRGAYAHMKQQFPEEYHREPSSLLPWAITDNGDSISWVLRGRNSGDWQTVIHGDDQAEEEVYDCSGIDVLEYILAGAMKSDLLPEDFILGAKEFQPIR